MRVRLPIALLLTSLIVGASPVRAQSPVDSVHYSKVREFFVPFKTTPNQPIKELRLFVQRNGGSFEFLTRADPTQKGFQFKANQDGTYGMTVQTIYNDGSSDPTREQMRPDLTVVIDTVPPKITLRPFSMPDGSAGVEWDVSDEYLDPNSIKLEYRWPGMMEWAPINREDRFKARDQRTWLLRPEQRIEIRVRASDFAKNETISQGVTTSSTVGDNRQFIGSTSGGGNLGSSGSGETVAAPRVNGTQHFVKDKTLTFHYNVKVGPSGIKKVSLWMIDEKNVWTQVPAIGGGAKEIPAIVPGDQPRTEPLTLEYTVDKDGVYGFIIIVESRAGTSAREPRLGDPPTTTVVVDTTAPVVKMTEPKVRPNGSNAGALVDIVWEATDKNLAAAPITLEYAETRNGTWRVIADKIDNTGKYTWAVPPTEPYSFFVRVKAIDRAGNMSTAESKEPVIVDLTVPQVEIRDVAPGK